MSQPERRTKIVATIGPASAEPKTLDALVAAGINVARLNFSHGDTASHRTLARRIRAAAKRAGKTIGVLVDVPGPKFRVGKLPEEGVDLEAGCAVVLDSRSKTYRAEDRRIPLLAPGLAKGIRKGDSILLDDGYMALEALNVRDGRISARVVRGGRLTSNKGVNLPGAVALKTTLTKKDRAALEFAVAEKADLVALSFVRSAADVKRARRYLNKQGGERLPVIAKLEKPEAIEHENLTGILRVVQGVMVARGDLGVELAYERVPLVQKDVIEEAHAVGLPAIVATQMLQSMTEQRQPTRAEVSDVAGAVFDSADAVMLSAETASGQNPVAAVQAMDRILRASERRIDEHAPGDFRSETPEIAGDGARAIAATAANLARRMGAAGVVVITTSGATARLVSATHPSLPIYAYSPNLATVRQLSLLYGVQARRSPVFGRIVEVIRFLNKALRGTPGCRRGASVVVVFGTPFGVEGSTNTLRIHRIGEE